MNEHDLKIKLDSFLFRYYSAAAPSYYTTTTYAPAPVYYSPPVYTTQAPSYYPTEATVYYKEEPVYYTTKYAEPSYYASAGPAQTYSTTAAAPKYKFILFSYASLNQLFIL